MIHLGVELHAPELLAFCLVSRNGHFVSRSDGTEALRDSCDGVAVAHPHLRIVTHVLEKRIALLEAGQVGTTVLASTCRLDASATDISHVLRSVADAEDGIFAADAAQVNLERMFVID